MTAQDLKNSILQLAVQGKLVEQRAEEGTAKDLLEQIKAEKEQLIKNGKIKKEKPLPMITEDEIPFEVPESWEWVYINEIAFVTKLAGFEYTKYIAPNLTENGIPLFKGKNIQDGKLLYEFEAYIPEEVSDGLMRSQINKKCLLTPYVGTIGNIAIFDGKRKCHLGSNVGKIELYSSCILEEYMLQYLKSRSGYKELTKYKKATAQESISIDAIRNVIIPIPPLEEQKRIVTKIQELMSYIEKYDKAYSKLDAFNKKFPEDMQKSILQYAIQGKLVEQCPEEGTAEELYQQIQEEKAKLIKEGKIKKEKPLAEITEDEIPFEIPESWKWVRLGDIFQINPRNNIEDNIDVSFMPMTLLESGYKSEFSYEVRKWGDVRKGFTHFKDEDIVMAKITPCFQNLKSAVMQGLENGYGAGTTELHVLRPVVKICLGYFLWFIKNPIFISNCEANMSGTAGQQRVGTDVVKNYLAPLPPLEEQKRIVAKIEELLPYCHQLVK